MTDAAAAPADRRPAETGSAATCSAAGVTSPIVLVTGPDPATVAAVASGLGSLGLAPIAPSPDAHGIPGARTPGPLGEVSERLLAELGGSALRPPALEAGFEAAPGLEELRRKARAAAVAARASGRPLVWADPVLCLLLPFWRRALDPPLALVLAARDPLEAASSRAGRDRIRLVHALALVERYLRAALEGSAGLPVYLCRHEALVEDPARLAKDLAAFLSGAGIPVGAHEERAAAALRAVACEASGGHAEAGLVPPSLARLDALVAADAGPHACFAPPPLERESEWTSALLDLERDASRLLDALDWTVRQIEPLLRVTPRTEDAFDAFRAARAAEQANEEDDADLFEPSGEGPYPLNASEDRRAYHRWLRARRLPVIVGGLNDPPARRAVTRAPRRWRRPLVSVLVPIWRPPLWALERCVGSVFAQRFADWQLCLCDDASGDPELSAYLRSLRRVDRRVAVTTLEENGGISAATNAALELATGRFVTFLDHDDELTPDALERVAEAIRAWPDADLLYSDEDKIDASGERFDPLFKPDWSPDLLLSFAYLCHLTVVRRELLVELGGLRSEFDGSQDYDLSLRASERARRIVHIPEVLYHWRTLPGSAASDSRGTIAKPWAYEAGKRALEDALARRGEAGEVLVDERFPGRYHVRRTVTSSPLVSIVVPFRDEPALLARCASTLRADPGYDRLELVLVDNGSELPETEALLERLQADESVRVIRHPGPFNWAAINNAAVRHCRGEVLLFANNDIEARAPRWLEAMLGHALRREVGAVGARLLYPDGAIQHAGVVIGLGGIAGHVLRGLPGSDPGYNSMAIATRNCSVVTGACMMTRREVFESVGGFDEQLPVAFNDVDYCLKLRERGLLVVYAPLAELVHHESRSRGHTDDLAESRRLVERWGAVIAAGDPYVSPHLSHWRYWCPLSTAQEDDRWKTYLETSVWTHASWSST
ncbi:MAG TPA: glycosyltransferase [Acidimicrobiales bacterium]|nr:glycosyltransferase [Acidimicrobiales bacterium]